MKIATLTCTKPSGIRSSDDLVGEILLDTVAGVAYEVLDCESETEDELVLVVVTH